MLVLGHTGITLGVAVLLNEAFFRRRSGSRGYGVQSREQVAVSSPQSAATLSTQDPQTKDSRLNWFSSLEKRIDIRILLLGALLPDIIDKPLGMGFLRDILSNGRTFGHTLLFLVFITIVGLWLYRSRGQLWLLVLCFSTFVHLVSDQMWLNPRTLFWPLYGFFFEKMELAGWLGNTLYAFHTKPSVYIPEIIGGVILIWFLSAMIRQKKGFDFIKYGNLC